MSDYLNVRRIEFSVTNRCNSYCKHCFVEEKERRSGPAAIDRCLAVEVVRKVVEAYHPTSLMASGGEPLLYPDVACAIHAMATACGIPDRTIITNAGTPRSEAKAGDLAFRLAESGVTGIWISVDVFHQEHIPLEVVERNVRAYIDAGIPQLAWNPCWVISADDDNPCDRRTRAVLEALAHLPVDADKGGNILQPNGNAQKWLRSYLPPKVPMPTGSCEDVPHGSRLDEIGCIGIEPGGWISTC